MDEIKNLQKESRNLMHKLERSLALQELVPNVFNKGRCTSYFYGNSFNPEGFKFVVRDGSGEKTEFSYIDAPEIIFNEFAEQHKSEYGFINIINYYNERKRL